MGCFKKGSPPFGEQKTPGANFILVEAEDITAAKPWGIGSKLTSIKDWLKLMGRLLGLENPSGGTGANN